MNEQGINGQSNPARPYSILGITVLCFSLMIFFTQFAEAFSKNKTWKRTIKASGIISMGFVILIFTKYHDMKTTMSSIFGLFVVIGIIREVYYSKLTIYKISRIGCILLLVINNYIYYSQEFITALPLLQKITFAMVLIWVLGLNYELTKKNKKLVTIMFMKS